MDCEQDFINALFDHRHVCIETKHRLLRIADALCVVGMGNLASEILSISNAVTVSADILVEMHGRSLAKATRSAKRFHTELLTTLVEKAS